MSKRTEFRAACRAKMDGEALKSTPSAVLQREKRKSDVPKQIARFRDRSLSIVAETEIKRYATFLASQYLRETGKHVELLGLASGGCDAILGIWRCFFCLFFFLTCSAQNVS